MSPIAAISGSFIPRVVTAGCPGGGHWLEGRAGLKGDGVFVDGDAADRGHLAIFSGDAPHSHIDEHKMVVGSATDEPIGVAASWLGQGAGVADDLLLVGFEAGCKASGGRPLWRR